MIFAFLLIGLGALMALVMIGVTRALRNADHFRCAWCGQWFSQDGKPCDEPIVSARISHGICPQCLMIEEAKLKAKSK